MMNSEAEMLLRVEDLLVKLLGGEQPDNKTLREVMIDVREPLVDVAKRADAFFMDKSPIHATLRRLSKALQEMEIPFAIAGAMAANAHGHKRTTADINVLLRHEDLRRFKERWIGCGWLDKCEGSKGFRETDNGVNIDVLIVGDYPGDGKPKPVAFPAPEAVAECGDEGIPYVGLQALIELKLASGMTAVHRPRDLDDTIQLIRADALKLDYGQQLDPYVREKYQELWQAAQVEEDY